MKKSRSRNRSRSRSHRRSRTRMRGGRKSRTRRRNRSRNRKRSRTHTRRRNRTRNRRRKRGGLYDKFTPLKKGDQRIYDQNVPAYGENPDHGKMLIDHKRERNIQQHATANPAGVAARRARADEIPQDIQDTVTLQDRASLANNYSHTF